MTVELYSGHKADLIFIFPGHNITVLITLNILQHMFTESRTPAVETCTRIQTFLTFLSRDHIPISTHKNRHKQENNSSYNNNSTNNCNNDLQVPSFLKQASGGSVELVS